MHKKALEIIDLSIKYPETGPALAHLDFCIFDGEFVVFMGKTGAGKSTLIAAISGLIPKVIRADINGIIRLKGTELQKIKENLAHLRGVLLQDFESQLFSTNVELEIGFVLENLAMPPKNIRMRVDEVIKSLSLGHLRNRNLLTLSGGEKQLVALASSISANPEVLLLDEPTSDLDPLGSKMIYKMLKKVPCTKILVENDPENALIADRIFLLSAGKIIKEGNPLEILSDNVLLLENGIRPIDVSEVFSGILTIEDALNFIKENRIKVEKIDFKDKEIKGEPIIECENVSFGYKKDEPILIDVNLKINQGDFLAIIGQNGSGKTTLANLLCGILPPQRGRIRIKGRDIKKYERSELSKLVGYVFQNPDHQLFCSTVKEEVSFAMKNFKYDERLIESSVNEALRLCDLVGYEEKDPFSLTKGEKQRLAVATVLAVKPEVIILDEPTTGLDYEQVLKIMDVLKILNSRGWTIIIITHSMWVVAEWANRAMVMAEGRIAIDAKTRELFTYEEELANFNLTPPQICRLGRRLNLKVLNVKELKQCISI